MHNQVISMGEWGWIIGAKENNITQELLKKRIQSLHFKNVKTEWINNEAMQLITSFGKETILNPEDIDINKIHNPVLYQYYLKGNWDLY